jgi:recombination protein RecT
MSNQLTEQKGSLRAILNSEAGRQQFATALPKHLTAERFCRVAITALTRTPKLADCTKESFFRCLMDLSAIGLEPDGRNAHLIPYGKECTLVIDYKGIAELVMRSGNVSSIHADKVCKGDIFEVDRGQIKKHVIDYLNPRGEAYAYYVLVRFKDGSEKSEVMRKDEVDSIMKRSQGYKAAIQYNKSHPWLTDYDEMAKKTVFRRCSKWLSLSPEIRTAFEKDDDKLDMRDVTPRPGFAAAFADEPPAIEEPKAETVEQPATETWE